MKVALITGASKGIGFETAKQLAQAGCFVFLACRKVELGLQALLQLQQLGFENVEFVQLDVTDINSIHYARKAIEERFNLDKSV